MLYRYVNTDVPPGGDGSAGDPYASLSEAEAENLNLVTATDSVTIFCSGSKVDTTGVYFLGWTTSSSYQIIIQGNRTTGAWDTGRYSLTVADGIVLQFGVAYVTARNLQLSSDDPIGQPCVEIWSAPAGDYTVERNLIRYRGAGAYDSGVTCRAASGTVYVRNNFIYGFGGTTLNRGIYARDATTVYADNNTIIDCGSGVEAFDSTPTIAVRNNITQGCTNSYVEPGTAFDTANSGYNLTDSATSPPGSTGNVTSTSLQFVNAANDDYQLHVSDVAAIGAGVDRSSLFSDDINGNTRYTWDIGAHAYIVPEAISKDSPAIIIRRPWTKQPPAGTLVDKSHPLAPTFMFVGGQKSTLGYDAVSGKKQDGGGGAYQYDGVEPTGQYDGAFFNNMALRIEQEGSFTWYVRRLSAWGTFDYFADFSAATGGVDIRIRNGDPVDDVFIEADFGNSTYDLTGIDDGYPHVLTWVYAATGSAADQHLYIDGALFGTLNQSKTASSGVDADISIGHEQSGGFSQLAGASLNAVMYHPRRLTASEVANLHGNIWQIFKSRTIYIGKPNDRRVVVF